jgi:sulfite exporter TauE/SafE
MFLFGLGTLPGILGADHLSAHVNFALKSHLFRQMSGALVIVYGI